MNWKILTATSFALLSAPVSAQILWQNVRVGMTLDQVRAAQPGATRPAEPETFDEGTACELQITGYAVQGDTYRVCFFLHENSLVQVMLTADRASRAQFDSTAVLLRGRYGAEMNPGPDPCHMIGDSATCTLDWLLPSGVNVSLLYMDIGGSHGLMNINYQVRIRRESNRL